MANTLIDAAPLSGVKSTFVSSDVRRRFGPIGSKEYGWMQDC